MAWTGKQLVVTVLAVAIAVAGAAAITLGLFVTHAYAVERITGLYTDGPILHWDAVDGATSYEVEVRGHESTGTTETSVYPSHRIADMVDQQVQHYGAAENVGWHLVVIRAKENGVVIAESELGTYLYFSQNADKATTDDTLTLTFEKDSFTYAGKPVTPVPRVWLSNHFLDGDASFTVSYANNEHAGTAMAMVAGIWEYQRYVGSVSIPFEIARKDISDCMALSKTKLVYNGKTQKPMLKVTDGSAIKKGSDYYAYWQPSSSKKAGTYTVLVEGVGDCCGTVELTYKILKAKNPLDVKGKTASVKRKNLKKETQTLKVTKVVTFLEEGKGAMSYALISAKKGSKSFKKYFKVAKQTGKVTIKKNKKMGKGTYKVKVKVKALGNSNYKPSTWKTVTFKVKVK